MCRGVTNFQSRDDSLGCLFDLDKQRTEFDGVELHSQTISADSRRLDRRQCPLNVRREKPI